MAELEVECEVRLNVGLHADAIESSTSASSRVRNDVLLVKNFVQSVRSVS